MDTNEKSSKEVKNSDLNKTSEKQNAPINNIFAPDQQQQQQPESLGTNLKQQYSKYEDLNKDHEGQITKLSWINPTPAAYESLLLFLKKRIEKGHGETILALGVSEGEEYGLTQSEISQSVNTLLSMESKLNVKVSLLRDRRVDDISDSNKCVKTADEIKESADNLNSYKYVNEYLIRKNFEEDDFIEVRVAVVGNVDAGKSTLLGVLTHGALDDGRGDARTKLFRHKHEIDSGRTSSVGNEILGFNSKGEVVNNIESYGSKILDWEKICRDSSKVITFIDLAGHEKYLKTTVFGMTGHAPDFCMLMVGANMGVIGMTKEHLGLALALNVPVFVVVTKIDMCPPNVYQDTLKILQKVLKSPGCRKISYLVETKEDVVTCALNFSSERLCPIFPVSNVTGQNLDLLKMFINLLNSRMESLPSDPAEFQLDEIYSVPGVGTVVSGTCYKGRIQMNDTLLLGPDLIGQFRQVAIKGIHRKRMPVKECLGGQTASFALKKIKRSELRKGMVLISEKLNPIATWDFEAEIIILHHPTTISINYQAMVHCGSIRQTATIVSMSVQHMRTGDRANVHFTFIKNPEYLKVGNKIIFREGRTKALGTITKVNLPQTQRTS